MKRSEGSQSVGSEEKEKENPCEQRKNCKPGGEMLGEALLGVPKATLCCDRPIGK